MRIGTYIDGFNLYYGARGLCGRGTPGWRWLDLRGLVTDLVGRRTSWAGATVDRVVYYIAGDLRGSATAGAGRHWWLKLTAADLKSHQLPDPVSRYRRPPGW